MCIKINVLVMEKVRKMRMGVLILLLLCSMTVMAQGKRVTLKASGLPLKEAIYQVERQSGYYKMNFNVDAVDDYKVTAQIQDATAPDAINQLLKGLPFYAKTEGQYIYIRKTSQNGTFTAQGRLTDASGEPLSGAVVKVVGTDKATVADADGNYKIEGVHEGDVLQYSYIGMKDYQHKASRKPVSIILENDEHTLDDVVVTGYQTLKREEATGSFQKITSKEMDKRYTGDIQTNLEGRVPGLIQYNNGVTDQLSIRGVSSLSASTTPLVVVNGLPIEGSINDINPNDVESITVLKDAAASAIYGARASNGVIVVVTKKATTEKLQVDFSSDLTIQNKYNYDNMNWMTAAEEMELAEYNFDYIRNDADAFESLTNAYNRYPYHYSQMMQLMMEHAKGNISDEEYESTKAEWAKHDYRKEWQDLMERKKVTQQYNLSLRTKGRYLSSSISANYKADNQGTPDLYNRTFMANYNGHLDVTKWLDLNFGVYVESGRVEDRADDIFEIYSLTSHHQYETIYSSDPANAGVIGEVDTREATLQNNTDLKSEAFSLVDEVKQNYSKTRTTLLRPFVHLNVHPIDGLNLSAQFQYEDYYSKEETQYKGDSYTMRHLYNLYTYKGEHYLPDGGLLDVSTYDGADYTFRTQATYNKTLADVHAFEVLAGFEYRQHKIRTTYNETVGYDDLTQTNSSQITNFYDAYHLENTDLGESYTPLSYRIGENTTSDILHRFYSYYFTGNYTYDHRYSVSGSYRVDKADLFGTDPKFRGRPLWSVGLSWNMHNESWLKDVSWIDMLKLRASYGTTGNINSSVSSYLTASIKTEYIYGGKRAVLNSPPNDELRWEKTQTWNGGIDFSFFHHRLSGSLDVYTKNGSDILSTTDVDPTTGWTSLTINDAKIRNTGVELQLDGTILPARSRSQVGVDASMTFAYNKNEVTNVDHDITSGYEALQSDTYHKGYPVHSLFSMRYAGLGLDENGDQQVYFYKADGTKTTAATYEDELEPEDVVFSGSLDPKVSMSFTPTITYQGFTLSALFVAYAGHYMRMNADEWTIITGMDYETCPTKSLLNYWRSEDKTAYLANGYAAYNMRMYDDDPVQMDINVEHADYMKLRSLTLSYAFNDKVLHALHLRGLSLRLQMNNVFTWARNSRSLDPEAVDPYTGENLVKTPKSYVMSLNVNF
jgi:TonB-linked SusC/RagA family outer membrane protein